jgi:hypothetical protein
MKGAVIERIAHLPLDYGVTAEYRGGLATLATAPLVHGVGLDANPLALRDIINMVPAFCLAEKNLIRTCFCH